MAAGLSKGITFCVPFEAAGFDAPGSWTLVTSTLKMHRGPRARRNALDENLANRGGIRETNVAFP